MILLIGLVIAASDPFAFGDFTWLNGNNRQKQALLDTPYFTGSALVDVNYDYSLNHPSDDTVTGSTVIGRHNEIELLIATAGGDFHYQNVRATLTLQVGSTTSLVTSGDASVKRGQYDLLGAFRYLREAYAGYHFDVLHGINIDAGIFMSYIGMASYLNFENWSYQRSFVADATPYFFQGLRLQMFITDRLKIEPWLVNGWQSYGKFNTAPGGGVQVLWRPTEWLSLTSNEYVGTDSAGLPKRVRAHTDDSIQLRYFQRAHSHALSKLAFSLALDAGFESGQGVSPLGNRAQPAQNFLGFSLANRFWFYKDLLALTIAGGMVSNPGRYLVLPLPGPAAPAFAATPGSKFAAWETSATIDVMPMEQITVRLEMIERQSSVPYFAGSGGVSSATPDLVKSEARFIVALLFRM